MDYNTMSLWSWEATLTGRPTLRLHGPTKRDFRTSVETARHGRCSHQGDDNSLGEALVIRSMPVPTVWEGFDGHAREVSAVRAVCYGVASGSAVLRVSRTIRVVTAVMPGIPTTPSRPPQGPFSGCPTCAGTVAVHLRCSGPAVAVCAPRLCRRPLPERPAVSALHARAGPGAASYNSPWSRHRR
jgi:hypothetical protein